MGTLAGLGLAVAIVLCGCGGRARATVAETNATVEEDAGAPPGTEAPRGSSVTDESVMVSGAIVDAETSDVPAGVTFTVCAYGRPAIRCARSDATGHYAMEVPFDEDLSLEILGD